MSDPYSIDDTAQHAGLDKYSENVSEMTGNVIGTTLSMVVVLFLGLMIYAGITWMLDRGNEERSKKALHTITAAVIGIAVVLAAYAITRFVLQGGGVQ